MRPDGKRVKESINLETGDYHPAEKPKTDDLHESVGAIKKSALQALLSGSDPAALYAWRVWSKTLSYAAGLVPEIADDIVAVDAAMRDGYQLEIRPV